MGQASFPAEIKIEANSNALNDAVRLKLLTCNYAYLADETNKST